MKVAGKVITVIGGGDGIGRALVLELLGRGAAVASFPGRVQEVFGQGCTAPARRPCAS